MWNPTQYTRFTGDRGRPFFDLLSRVAAERPRRVVDLGCGTGNLTAALPARWPSAHIVGFDSSTAMIAEAVPAERLTFHVGDIENWLPGPDVDVLISNAALHWVPTHRELLRRWAAALPIGAWMAWQVPGNFRAPSHTLLADLAESPKWAPQLAGALRLDGAVGTPKEYAALLLDAGWTADTWESTYVHVLSGDDAVLEWVRGSTLGRVRAILPPDDLDRFEGDYAELLRVAYPPGDSGTLYPFRRVFAVGRKA